MQIVAVLAFVAAGLDLLNILPGAGAKITPALSGAIILYLLYDSDQLNRVKVMVRGVSRKLPLPAQDDLKKRKPKSQPNPKAEYRAIAWNGLTLRSQSEVKIAKALDHRGILFLAGARIRLKTENHRQTREVDFLIHHQGKWGILEVDGPHHQHSTQADEWRDARFGEEGISVSRFPADLCYRQPGEVVEAFLKQLSESLPHTTIISASPPAP
jgi:very-short-patch-repair endonuclease